MESPVLEQAIAVIEDQPESGQSLLLYALLSTLGMERGGHMFMLGKLREMEPPTRDIAYGLMELMARGGNRGEAWEQAMERAHRAVRGK